MAIKLKAHSYRELGDAGDALMKRIAAIGEDGWDEAEALASEAIHIHYPWEKLVTPVMVWVTDDGILLSLDCRHRHLTVTGLTNYMDLEREDMRPMELEGIRTLFRAVDRVEIPEEGSEGDEDSDPEQQEPQQGENLRIPGCD